MRQHSISISRNLEYPLKISHILAAALLASIVSARAQGLTYVNPGYSAGAIYTDPNSENIVGFDWTNTGALVYQTSDPDSFAFLGVYSVSNGVNSTIDPGNTSDFAGAGVLTIGNFVYYNYSDFNGTYINQYGPTNGTPSLTLASTAPNYGLYTNNGKMYITAADQNGINDIYVTTPGSDGSIATPVDLGVTSGGSGPLAFDSAGDLFYAPGYGDPSIYKWTAAELAAAEANPTADPLTLSSPFASYANISAYSAFANGGGATSLLVESDGDVLVTLTSFDSPSDLVDFSNDGQTATTILTDSGLLGDLGEHDGNTYIAAGSQIDQLQLVPEPSAALSIILGLGALFLIHIRKRKGAVSAS